VRRREVRSIAVALSLTRITLLAHWASDVVAGYALGAGASLDIDKTAGALELKRRDGNGELAVRGLLYGELDLLGRAFTSPTLTEISPLHCRVRFWLRVRSP
jgi:hypothetical protein